MKQIFLTIWRNLVWRNPVKTFFVGVIRFYQVVISPGMPGRCKYYPSCSQYALDAVREYGATRGFVLGGWRVLRCNPLSYGGYDPISRQKLFRSRSIAMGDPQAPGSAAMAGADDADDADGAASGREAAAWHLAAHEPGGFCSHDRPAGRATRGRHAAHSHLVRG